MRHDYRADEPRGNAPARLISILVRAVLIQKLHVERAREIIAEIMRRAGLQALAVLHHRFHAVRGDRARELFLFRLLSAKHGQAQHVV